jgi:glycosyltransferase involved in cell wall biosynthesis
MFAPIVVFGYNRPNHLERALNSIESNPEAQKSDVYIFIDGPKSGKANFAIFEECKAIAEKDYKFFSKKIIARNSNLGLANSIRTGLDFIFQKYETVIVIEDDILLASTALKYLNEGLNLYTDNPKVSSIHSYQYPLNRKLHSCVALRGADCWGWATWKDRWQSTSFNGAELLEQIIDRGLIAEFDLNGAMDFSDMLKLQIDGKIDSWAICWHASMFLQDRFCIYPPTSLSSNIGMDGSGVHSGIVNIFQTTLSKDTKWKFPKHISESSEFRELLYEFYSLNKPKRMLLKRILNRFKNIVKNLPHNSI